MYDVTEEYKELILADSTRHALHIYIDGTEIDSKYILDFKVKPILFENNEFCFGNTPQRTCELKIHKDALPDEYDEFYITTGIETTSLTEIVPIGYFYKDDIAEKDSYTITLNIGDKMSEFDEAFDGSELNYPITNLELLQAICDKHGIELGSTSFTNSDSEISVYDSTVTARTYIGYIAELAGGFATIGRDGKLYIRTIGEDTDSLAINKFAEYEWGDEFVISRVAYEDGIQDFKSGDETANTVWLDSNNMFVSSQEQIDNIYNDFANAGYYSFSGTSIIDPAWDIGDVIEVDGKNIIFQGTMSYKGKFKAEFDSEIQAKTQESSMQTTLSDTTKIRRVQSSIDQIEGTITQVVEELTEYESNYTELKLSVDGIEATVENITDYTREKTQIHQLYLSEDEVPTGEGYVLDFIIYGGDNFTETTITLCASTKSKGYGDNLDILLETGEILTTEDEENLIVGDETYCTPILKIALDDVLRSLTIYTEEEETTYYDTLEITQDGTVVLTRRIGVDDEGNLYLLEEEIVTTYGIEELLYVWSDTAVLPTFEEGTYFFIKELNSITYYAQYTNSETYLKIAELGTYITQNAESVQIAWNQISQYIKFEGTNGLASLNIYDEDDLLLMSLNQDGQTFYNGSEDEIGKVGVIRGEDNENDYLAFAIPVDWANSTDTNMAWGLLDTNDDFYPVFYMQSYYGEDSSEYGGELVIEGNLRVTEIIPNDYLCIYDDSYTYLDCEQGAISAGVPISAMEGFSYIGGTANGTLFPDMPNGGITVSNGLITSWDMTGYWSGTVTYGGLTLTYTNGLLTDVS